MRWREVACILTKFRDDQPTFRISCNFIVKIREITITLPHYRSVLLIMEKQNINTKLLIAILVRLKNQDHRLELHDDLKQEALLLDTARVSCR